MLIVVNVEYYVCIIVEKVFLCRLICMVIYIVLDGYEREDDVDGFLNEVEKKILEVFY